MESTATRPYLSAPPSRPAAAQIIDRVRARWAGMGGRIGMGFCAFGFFMIFVAWNGAAGKDHVPGQLPYLISGGVSGLGFIVIGAALLITESNRRDRAILERQLLELNGALSRLSSAPPANGAAPPPTKRASRAGAVAEDLVIAGRASFHRPDCGLVSGRDQGSLVERDEAADRGLAPCRICKP